MAHDSHAKPPLWRDARKLEIAAQVLFVLLLVLAVWGSRVELQRSFIRQNIRLEWGFWRQPAGFQLTALTWTIDLETLRPKLYDPGDSAGEAMIAGLFNTVKVAVLGIVLAVFLGLFVGISRLSRNWLVNRLALAYVELFRNTPLLVQLFVIYFVVFLQFPSVSSAIVLPGPLYLSQRGVYSPRPELADDGAIWLAFVVIAIV